MMQPIIEDDIEYLSSVKPGLGKKAAAQLYSDKIVITGKDGTVLETIPIASIKKINWSVSMAILTLEDGVRNLNFRPTLYRLLGPIGLLLSGSVAKTQRWRTELGKLVA